MEEPLHPDLLTCCKVLLARARGGHAPGKVTVPSECMYELMEAVERADGRRPPMPPEFMSAESIGRMVSGQ